MDFLKLVIINFLGYLQTRYALFKVRRLSKASGESVEKLCRALEEAITQRILPDEVNSVRRIEHLRSQLLTSDRQILFTDYGAGTPDIARTTSDSYRGVTDTKLLSEVAQWSKPFFWGLLLFKLVRQFRPTKCIELGTCLGISGSYMASAQCLSGGGKLMTLEGADALSEISKSNFAALGLTNVSIVSGRFQDTLSNVLENGKLFDFVFIDGHHDEKATLKYYNQISPYLSEGAVVIFDDIAWSSGMKRAWQKLKADGRFSLTADLSAIGVCIVCQTAKDRRHIMIPLRVVGAFLKW